MQALITGGAGFVGSHLSERLLNEGYRVTVLDDLSTGSMANISHLKGTPGFHYVIDSIMNKRLLAELVDECDIVFHLAAAVGVRLIVESPVRTLHTNVHGTEVILDAATKKRKKVLVVSTSEVYGKSTKIPFNENDDLVIGPPGCSRWSYACSKAMDEFLALSYYSEKNLPVIVVRLFNTVGPRQIGTYGMVLPRFVEAALAGRPITIYGDGNQTRCFGWVGDVVGALSRLGELDSAVGNVFNIGSNEEISINGLADVVKKIAGSNSPVVHISYDEAYGKNFEDMYKRVPDLTKIKNAIGYTPTKCLREIVQAVAEYLGPQEKMTMGRTADLVSAD
jgi:UDP-glucose 4-epimerase